MPKNKVNVHEMTVPEAEDRIRELKKELFHLRFRNAMRQLDNPLQIRFVRKDVARLMTALSEHRRGIRSLATGESAPAESGTKKAAGKGKKPARTAGKKKE